MTSNIFDSWTARIIASASILTALYAGIHYVVKAEVSDLNTKMETTNTEIAQLRDSIVRIDGDVKKANERIDKALTDALDKLVAGKGAATKKSELLDKGQTILAIAKSIDAKLATDSLAEYGKSVSALTNSPSLSSVAWRNLTQAVDYKTFLNIDYTPKPSDFTPATGNEGYRHSINLFPDRPVDGSIPAVRCGLQVAMFRRNNPLDWNF